MVYLTESCVDIEDCWHCRWLLEMWTTLGANKG